MPTTQEPHGGDSHAGIGALVRLGWIAVGFVALVMTTLSIASHPTWTLGWRDFVFWTTALVTGLLRYVDVTRLHGDTANGEPATLADLRRYLFGLACSSVLAWLIAQSVHL